MMKFGVSENKSYDILIRKFEEGETIKPVSMRSIRLYGHREKNIEEVLSWLKKKLGME